MPPWKNNHKSKLPLFYNPSIITFERNESMVPRLFMSRQTSVINNDDQQQNYDQAAIYRAAQINQAFNQANNLTESQMIKKIFIRRLVLLDQSNSQEYYLDHFEVNINEQEELLISDVIKDLKRINNNKFESLISKSYISVYSKEQTDELDVAQCDCDTKIKVYTFCGQDPLKENTKVRADLNTEIIIKIRPTNLSMIDTLLQEQNIETQEITDIKQSRVKERKISEVIQKVALWRRFYTGFYNENKTFIQMPLNEAANKVNISKKTLDDYLLQIRCGKRYGFDFNKNQNERIGKLRSYVKKQKKKAKGVSNQVKL